MRKRIPTRPARTGPDLHFSVREAYRRAMSQRRTEAEAYDLAVALVLKGWPHVVEKARRLVAFMLATDPAPLNILLDKVRLP